MPSFHYKSVTAAGETLDGVMEATDRDTVIANLQASGNYPVRVERARSGGGREPRKWTFGQGVSQKQIGMFTQELATLLRAGLPLDRSLEILADTGANPKITELIAKVLEQIMAGKSFADALEDQSGAFTKIYVNTIRAGESSGSLDTVLERLADYMEKARELRETIVSAMIYPAILLAVAGLSLVLLLTQVVPQFSDMFAQAGSALPAPTQFVVSAADWLRESWWVLLLILLVGLVALDFALRTPSARIHLDRFTLALPLIGDLARKIEVARFTRTFGTLLGNGVNPVASLAIVKETMANLVLSGSITALAQRLKEGQGIAAPLEQTALFPKLAVQMIRVGEETGNLEPMLLKVADIYDKEVSQAVKRMLTLLEPMLILILGAMIAGIIISVLLAVLNVNDLAF
ncbi:MAG: type II secretion system F family protein [Sphingomonadales bacterium]